MHQPYTHGSYDREVAYVDQAIGKFRQALTGRGKDTLVVLTSDHGESLGEHGEETHGYFIYQSTLHVPLILHWPTAAGHPARVDDPASLIDVAPTLLDFLGVPAPTQFQGRTLLRSPGDKPIYSESMYARDHLGCSALRSIRLGRYKYIDAPKPELYDLATDPGESQNRYDRDRAQAQKLSEMLRSLSAPARRPAPSSTSPEVLARLRSLGYLGGGPPRTVSGVDPKDRLQQYLRYGQGIRLANAGQLAAAIGEFRKVLAEDPQNTLAHFYVGVCYYRLHQLDEAVTALHAALAVAHHYPPAEELLGTIWLVKHDYKRAREQFEQLAASTPASYGAHYNLGILALREGRSDDALRELLAACRADPTSAQPHAALGSLYNARGDADRAKEEFRQAIALDPNDQASRKNLEQLVRR